MAQEIYDNISYLGVEQMQTGNILPETIMTDNSLNATTEEIHANATTSKQLGALIEEFATSGLFGRIIDLNLREKWQNDFGNVASNLSVALGDFADVVYKEIEEVNNCIASYGGSIPIPENINFAQEQLKSDNKIKELTNRLKSLDSELQTAYAYCRRSAKEEAEGPVYLGRPIYAIEGDIRSTSIELEKWKTYLSFMNQLFAKSEAAKAAINDASLPFAGGGAVASAVAAIVPSKKM